MRRLPFRFVILLTFALLAIACQREEPSKVTATEAAQSVTADRRPAAAPPAPAPRMALPAAFPPATESSTGIPTGGRLMVDPIAMQRFELPTEALAVWRQFAAQQPTLLLISGTPLLVPAPDALQPEITTLLNEGSPATIAARSLPYRPDPLLMPEMAVDAALQRGWFGQLAWALPLRDPNEALSLEIFRRQLLDSRLATEEEVETFNLLGNMFTGQLRHTPVTAAPLAALPDLPGPVVVHIDLSYFQPLYKNEIKTPLLSIIGGTCKLLQSRQLEVLAVTLSLSNLNQSLSLDIRFLGEILTTLARQPAMLDKPLPVNWQRKANTLYLENFFQKELTRETLLAMEKAAPRDASVKFALYREASRNKEGSKALDYLAKAVALDKVYALEYLAIAEKGDQSKGADEALRMLRLAAKAFPDNPHIQLQIAQLSYEVGDSKSAQQIAAKLQQLPWSPSYYANMTAYLDGFEELLKQPPPPKPKIEVPPKMPSPHRMPNH